MTTNTETIQKTTGSMRAQMSHEAKSELHTFTFSLRAQVSVGAFMSLGAHNFGAYYAAAVGSDATGYSFYDPTMSFDARIIRMAKTGGRGEQVRNMRVDITLNALDYYDVLVTYPVGGKTVVHYEGHDIDASSIGRILLALDYDGDEVLNPRYI